MELYEKVEKSHVDHPSLFYFPFFFVSIPDAKGILGFFSILTNCVSFCDLCLIFQAATLIWFVINCLLSFFIVKFEILFFVQHPRPI